MIPQVHPACGGPVIYGTSSLIRWCQNRGWKYRIRLKKAIMLIKAVEITTGFIGQGIACLPQSVLNTAS